MGAMHVNDADCTDRQIFPVLEYPSTTIYLSTGN